MSKDTHIKNLSDQLFKLEREYDAKVIAYNAIE